MYTYEFTYEWNILYPIKIAFKDFFIKNIYIWMGKCRQYHRKWNKYKSVQPRK